MVNDVEEVLNYVAALNGTQKLRGGLPLSLRLIREIPGVLLARQRGSDKSRGEFRESQNWIGGTRPRNAHFVPPPPELVLECMGAHNPFLHEYRSDLPLLVKAGIVHVPLEARAEAA